VRQLVTPLPMWGEGTTARYLAESGAGLMLEPKDLTVDLLRDQVSRLLTEPSFKAGTERLYAQMRAMPSPDETVRRLEALTEENRAQRRAVTL
jgi:UDP:flavonoid glycosyltransferase YjiC (YdhE family)